MLDLALILSSDAGGGGADKLVTEAGNTEGGSGEDEVLEALVGNFESTSFGSAADEGDGSISADIFIGAAVVEILTFDDTVAGVEAITLFNGGALKRKMSFNYYYQ